MKCAICNGRNFVNAVCQECAEKKVCRECGMPILGAYTIKPINYVVHANKDQCFIALKAYYAGKKEEKHES